MAPSSPPDCTVHSGSLTSSWYVRDTVELMGDTESRSPPPVGTVRSMSGRNACEVPLLRCLVSVADTSLRLERDAECDVVDRVCSSTIPLYCTSVRGNRRKGQPGELLYCSSEVTDPDLERARATVVDGLLAGWGGGGCAGGGMESDPRNVKSCAAAEHDIVLRLIRSSAVRLAFCARVPVALEPTTMKSSDKDNE